MRDRGTEDTRLGWAILVLAIAILIQAACFETEAAECHNGDIYVRDNGDTVIACVDGQYEPMLTLSESEDNAMKTAIPFGMGGLGFGLGFGLRHGYVIGRRKRA